MAHITLSGARADFGLSDRISAFVEQIAAWRAYRKTVSELVALTDRELTDIGISRADIPAIARGEIKPIVR